MDGPGYDPRLLDGDVPLVGVDVDGVLNALGHQLTTGYATTEVLGYRITTRLDLAEVVAPLVEADAEGRCVLFWATMWEAQAAEHLAPVIDGLGAGWPWLAFGGSTIAARLDLQQRMHAASVDDPAHPVYFKSPVLADLAIETGRRVIWVDDAVTEVDDAYFAGLPGAPGRVTCVRVEPTVGITPDDVARVLALLDG